MAFIETNNDQLASRIWVSDVGTDAELMHGLKQVADAGTRSVMILACSANQHSAQNLSKFLQQYSIPVCGGIFPSIFFSNIKLETGLILVGFPFSISVACYQGLSDNSFNISKPNHVDGENLLHSRDLMVFIDALTPATETFINQLHETIGGGIGVIGGGAGAIDFIPRPCIFTRSGLLMGVALVVQLPVKMGCAVNHGWEILSEPCLVTEAKGTMIKTINYLPAFQIYKEIIETITHYRFTQDNFFDIAQNFPLGIQGITQDILVRDPVQLKSDKLVCVGRVPINAMIYVLQGKTEKIINAAQEAGTQAKTNTNHNAIGLTMVFDCVSRVLYLRENFSDELAAIRSGVGDEQMIVGALSIGEIANTERGTINLLNKSITIGNI